MTTQAQHTPRGLVDFLDYEILTPFPESCLYDDYEEDWTSRAPARTPEQFAELYGEARAFIRLAPEMLEALEMLVYDDEHTPTEWPSEAHITALISRAKGGK